MLCSLRVTLTKERMGHFSQSGLHVYINMHHQCSHIFITKDFFLDFDLHDIKNFVSSSELYLTWLYILHNK